MEKGVGGALQPISIDEDKCIVSTNEVLRYIHAQVNRCTLGMTLGSVVYNAVPCTLQDF